MDQIKFRKGSKAYALASAILDLARDVNGRVTMPRLDAALIEISITPPESLRAMRRLQRGYGPNHRLKFSKPAIRYLLAYNTALQSAFPPKKAIAFADEFIGLSS